MAESLLELLPEKQQMEQYAEAFYGLARMFQSMPCQKTMLGDREIEDIIRGIWQKVCINCSQEQQCWKASCLGSQYIYDMLRELEHTGAVSEEHRQEIDSWCRYSRELCEQAENRYGQARITLMWQNRLMEQRNAAGEQIFQTAELLRKAAEHMTEVPEKAESIRKRLCKALGRLEIELDSMRMFQCGYQRQEVYLCLHTNRKLYVSAHTIAELLSEYLGQNMRPAWNCQAAVNHRMSSFHFVPETSFQILCGISRITKDGEMVSGDNYSLVQRDTGKVIMSLADGMGSGVQACRESEKVIELLEQFLDAGFPQETAVRMINSCLLLQNQEQIFSTLDLAMIDLYQGSCDMIKSGAAPTFLVHGNEIEVIDTETFPTGVLQQSDYSSQQRKLYSGDTIIMMTDGVLDALPEEKREQKMVELIGRTATRNAKEYARRLMEKVYLMQKLHAKDDMTILVGTIWKK